MRLYTRWVLFASSLAVAAGCSAHQGPVGDDDDDEIPWEGGPVTCSPGTVACIGAVAWTCNETGDSYEAGRNCLDGGESCVPGDGCGDCVDGATACDGDTPWRCDGGRMQEQDSCGAPTVCNFGRCEDLCDAAATSLSYEGCEYFAVDLPNAAVEGGPLSPDDGQFAVVVSNGDPISPVRVSVYTGDATSEELLEQADVEPRRTEVIELGPQNVAGTGTTGRAFRIVSDRPVTAYQFNPLNNSEEAFSNDASLLIPVAALGDDYLAVTGDAIIGESDIEEQTPADWGAFVAVVGVSETPVGVEVTPTADIAAGGGLPGGLGPFSATLGRYEVLNVESIPGDLAVAGSGNLSGTRIVSDGPVAVFSGNVATVVPSGVASTCCADHLEEQLFPLSSWGARLVSFPSQSRVNDDDGRPQADVFRITAGATGVDLAWDPAPPAGAPLSLAAGQSVEFSTNQPFGVQATGKISLAQFLTSSGQVIGPILCEAGGSASECPYASYDPVCAPITQGSVDGLCYYLCDPGGAGATGCPFLAQCRPFDDDPTQGLCLPMSDPSMILVPPVEQFRSDYVFLTPNDYEHDYLNVVAPAGTAIELDGDAVGSLRPIGTVDGVDYEGTQVEIHTDGTHVVTASQPVGLLVYGYDRDVSYGYPAGLDLETIGIE